MESGHYLPQVNLSVQENPGWFSQVFLETQQGLGHQSLPPTNLDLVDEEMVSAGGRPLHIDRLHVARNTA
ncbi:hypothetical protein TNCV_2328141 [Trichonephila clavipes]|nr:hypothetical protein TNCV_2328141 [Trichonephila clavipes]